MGNYKSNLIQKNTIEKPNIDFECPGCKQRI